MKNSEALVKEQKLRVRQKDPELIKSILASARETIEVVKHIDVTDKSATLIFREVYESIRQLGDALWRLEGYEPLTHDISLDILKNSDIKNKLKLNHLDRFKKIRHDANYRGFVVSASQAKEILDFWDLCGEEIMKDIKKQIL